jgi:hypothetical protein
MSSSKINWTLESSKTIFITGDSYPECALNDSIFSEAINISSSADTYIYSYVKIRKFIFQNPQIKTVILGFSYHNLQYKNDSFLKNASPGISKFVKYYYLMDDREIFEIFKLNYNIIIKGLGACYQKVVFNALTSINGISFKDLNLGGYRRLYMYKLKENLDDIKRTVNVTSEKVEPSQVQIRYLHKIERLCKKQGVRLILLNTPIHPEFQKILKKDKEYFMKYCEQNRIIDHLLNYADFPLPDSCYADAEHLNYHGADDFSKMIREELVKKKKE